MRKLMWFAVGFTAACALGIYYDLGNWMIFLWLTLLLIYLLTLWIRGRKEKPGSLILLGCAAAFLWVWIYHVVYINPARNVDPAPQQCSITVSDYSKNTDYGSVVEGKLIIEGRPYRTRVYLNRQEMIEPGDILTGKFSLSCTVGGRPKDEHFGSDGIFLLAYERSDFALTRTGARDLRYFPARLRQSIIRLLDTVFPQDTLPFVRALLLGDRSLLDYETNTALSISGIRHVVAVSGLHVSILLGVIFSIMGYRRFTTPLIGWIALLLFAAVTGFTPSVVRSCIMYSLMLGSLMLQKEYDPPTALAFTVLVMLICNPVAVSSVGLQLSAGCLVGIFLFSEKIRQFLMRKLGTNKDSGKRLWGRIKSWFAASVSVTLSTWITTSPLCAVYFGTVSLVGVITNLLTLWLITIIFWGMLVVCLISALWLQAGQLGAWVLAWPVRLVLLFAKTFSSFPLAAVYTCSDYIVWWLVLCYALFIVFMLFGRKHKLLMGVCMAAGLVCAVGVSWLEPWLDNWNMTVLDVGQGQCIYLQNHDKHYMVDCGGDSDIVAADSAAEFLLSRGITELDGIILTHSDSDHAGGVGNLLKRVDVNRIYLPKFPDAQMEFEDLALECSDVICWMEENTVNQLEDLPITLITGSFEKSENESSVCVLFQPENCDILITGDRNISGERALLSQFNLPDLEVLVVGHHGSKSATGIELLTACQPETAVISVGKDNSYGHPSIEVLERLAIFNTTVLRTDMDGTITIRG